MSLGPRRILGADPTEARRMDRAEQLYGTSARNIRSIKGLERAHVCRRKNIDAPAVGDQEERGRRPRRDSRSRPARPPRCPQLRGLADSLQLIFPPGALGQRGGRLFADGGGHENLVGRRRALRAGGDVHHRADRGQVMVRAAKLAEIDLAGVEADSDADRCGLGAEGDAKALRAARAKAPGSSARPRPRARHGPHA